MNNIAIKYPCLTEDLMLRYLNDGCSKAEINLIDRHLTHCNFCSDALDGAMSLGSDSLKKHLAQLDTKLGVPKMEVKPPTPLKVVKSSNNKSWLAAAAASALILGGSVVYYISDKKAVSSSATMAVVQDSLQNQPLAVGAAASADATVAPQLKQNTSVGSKVVVPALTKADSMSLAQNKTVGDIPVNVTVMEKENAGSPVGATSSAPIAEAKGKDEMSKVGGYSKNKADEIDKVKEVVVTSSSVSKSKREEDAKPATSMTDVYSGAANQNSSPRTPSEETAAKPVKKAKSSAPASASVPVYDANTAETSYRIGQQFYQDGKYKQAISELNIVIARVSSGVEYESSLWLLANSYLKLEKNSEAKKILNRILSESGTLYKASAKSLLQKL
jgi:TolA-binding protein